MRVLLVSGAVAIALSAPASLARRPPPVLLSYTLGTPTYSFGHGICVTALDGKVRVSLTGGDDREGAWSPNGRFLAFVRSEPFVLWLLDTRTHRLRRLVSNEDEGFISGPDWSPDGH